MKLNLALLLLILMDTGLISAQQKKETAEDSLYWEGHHVVANTPKLTIFKHIILAQDTLRRSPSKEIITILKTDSVQGLLKVRYLFTCTYRADTIFDGKRIRDAVMKKSQGSYTVAYKVGDNIFTYVISDFQDSQGRSILKDNPLHSNLYSCAQSEIWSRRNSILTNSILMRVKVLKSTKKH